MAKQVCCSFVFLWSTTSPQPSTLPSRIPPTCQMLLTGDHDTENRPSLTREMDVTTFLDYIIIDSQRQGLEVNASFLVLSGNTCALVITFGKNRHPLETDPWNRNWLWKSLLLLTPDRVTAGCISILFSLSKSIKV